MHYISDSDLFYYGMIVPLFSLTLNDSLRKLTVKNKRLPSS